MKERELGETKVLRMTGSEGVFQLMKRSIARSTTLKEHDLKKITIPTKLNHF